nr:hypothetical protein [Tanacetum cinerariifolium]
MSGDHILHTMLCRSLITRIKIVTRLDLPPSLKSPNFFLPLNVFLVIAWPSSVYTQLVLLISDSTVSKPFITLILPDCIFTEDPTDYPVDHDNEEEEEEPSGDDADEEDEEHDEDDDDEDEEHSASADSIPPPPTLRVTARISFRPQPPTLSFTKEDAESITPILPIPLPTASLPLQLLSSDRRADRPEVTLPPRKRLSIVHCSRYKARESSAAAAARPIEGRRADYRFIGFVEAEIRRRISKDIRYGIRDTWIDPRDVAEDEALTTLEGVNTRVTELAEVQEQDTQYIYRVMEDAQGRQTEIFQRVKALVDDSQYHYETGRLVDQEARCSREAWAHSIGLSLAGHLVMALGEIQALQAREQARAGAPEGAASTKMAPKRAVPRRTTWLNLGATSDPNQAPSTTTTSITNAQLQAMIDQGVNAALAARDANRTGDDSHTSGTGVRRTERVTRECTYQDFMKCQPLIMSDSEDSTVTYTTVSSPYVVRSGDVSPGEDGPPSDPDEDPEDDDDEDPEEDPADYPTDHDDADEEDKEQDEDNDDDEEEHSASADSIPPPPALRVTVRIYFRPQPPTFSFTKEDAERFLAMPIPPPSPLTLLSSPLPQIPSPPLPASPPILPIPLPTTSQPL